MEPDNSQFSEVPSDEAAEAVAAPKAKKPRKSRAAVAPVDTTGATGATETSEGDNSDLIGEKGDLSWITALGRGKTNIESARQLLDFAARNKKRHKVYVDQPADTSAPELPKASPEVEHTAGSHGSITSHDAASHSDILGLSASDLSRIRDHADICPSCAKNWDTYTSDVLPALHENGAHDPGKGQHKSTNMNINCSSCVENAANVVDQHGKGGHNRFPRAFKVLFGRMGCAQCMDNRRALLTDEHTEGGHVGKPIPGCTACDEKQDAEGKKSLYAAALEKEEQAKRAELIQIGLTGKIDPESKRFPRAKFGRSGLEYPVKSITGTTGTARVGIPQTSVAGSTPYRFELDPQVDEVRESLGMPTALEEHTANIEQETQNRAAQAKKQKRKKKAVVTTSTGPIGKVPNADEFRQILKDTGDKYPAAGESAIPSNPLVSRTTTDLGLTPVGHAQAEVPEPHAPDAEQKMWDDYLPNTPNVKGYVTESSLNCKNCGKMVSPIPPTVNVATGEMQTATCRSCARQGLVHPKYLR